MKRPLLLILSAITAAVLTAAAGIFWYTLPLSAAGLTFVAVKRKALPVAVAAAIAIILSAGGWFLRDTYKTPLADIAGEKGTFRAQLIICPDNDGDSLSGIFRLIDPSDSEADGEKLLITVYAHGGALPQLEPGDIISFTGTVKIPQGSRNPGGFDYARFLKASGVYAAADVSAAACSVIAGEALPFHLEKLYALRSALSRLFYRELTGDQAALISGMLFGGSEMPAMLTEMFRSCGIAHLLAVSGLHAGIIYAAAVFILKKLRAGRKTTFIAVTLLLIFYAVLTGLSVSVCRAAFMLIITAALRAGGKRPDGFNALCGAAAIILLINPFVLFTAGFLLSFTVTAALLLFVPVINARLQKIKKRRLRAAAGYTAVCLCAQAAAAPLQINIFHSLPLTALAANLIIAPVAAVAIIGALAAAAFSFVPLLSRLLFAGLAALLDFMLASAGLMASRSGAAYIPALPAGAVILWYLLLLAAAGYFYLGSRQNRTVFIAAAGVCILSIALLLLPPRSTQVAFLDVGCGDCAVITAADGSVVVIDCGDSGCGRGDLAPYLYSRGIYTVDTVILTHSDSDHAGGFADLLEGIRVKRLIFNADESTLARTVITLAAENGISVESAAAGDIIEQGDIRLDVLSPVRYDLGSLSDNEASLATRLEQNGNVFLFTADIQEISGGRLYETLYDDSVDVIKLAHHGGNYQSMKDILAAQRSCAAVISVGTNSYGLPAPQMTDWLSAQDIKCYRTDECGAVIFTLTENGTPEAHTYITYIGE